MVDDGVFSIALNGTRQSPINIETDKNVIETDEALDDLKFAYVPENCTQVLTLLDVFYLRQNICFYL